jgi:methyl-accepting chemotaxis protein
MSSTNAAEIAKLIHTTASNTESGIASIMQTVHVLRDITTGIKEMNQISEEMHSLIKEQGIANTRALENTSKMEEMAGAIANATSEQMNGTREVLLSVEAINKGAQRSALLSDSLIETLQTIAETTHNLNRKIAEISS